MKDLRDGKYIDDDSLLMYFADNGHFLKPEHRFNGEKPRIAVFFEYQLGRTLNSITRKVKGENKDYERLIL